MGDHTDALHETGNFLRFYRPAPQEALREIAAERAQLTKLLRCLDSFGYGGQTEASGNVDRCRDQSAILRVRRDPADEALVDLEDVDGQFSQAGE